MAYTNSSLVSYKRISPNRDVGRNHAIDTITIHCVVGQCSVETLGSIFAQPSKEASSNYGIGPDGRVGLYVEEKDRSWCSSSSSNDNRAVTIEVASDTTHPYAVTSAAYSSLINLVADICKRNGIKQLLWKADPSLIGHVDKQNMTVHRWFANKSCPGDYLYSRHSAIAAEVNKKLGSSSYITPSAPVSSSKPMLQYGSSGQYVSDLQTKLNKLGYNCGAVDGEFGSNTLSAVKKFQSAKGLEVDGIVGNNTWSAIDSAISDLDKKAQATRTTIKSGDIVTINSGAKYYNGSAIPSWVLNAKWIVNSVNGNRAVIDKDTSGKYSIMSPIDVKYLTAQNQSTSSPASASTSFKSYVVKVIDSPLNIRKGPGTNYAIVGAIKDNGCYTITKESSGSGANKWGMLKSGLGWISLDYTKKV